MRLLIVAAMIVGSLPFPAWASPKLQAYTPEQSDKYLTACMDKAKASAPPFISEKFFQSYCQCTLSYIQDRVKYEDFRDMAKAQAQNQALSPSQRQAADILDESLKVCFAQLGARFKR
ncbi:hypothetical protein RIF25_04180 [Thermosynechococcaceae cyanobacterium BACA0444]|uniref:Uncharacterized protein n=1 Tax=Pseudocalidococcus azoricus BACA0444 TaxID=2918990 RepID=A0AAE4FS91_9CYAN|nr:hypothetical protein [Pseudocalidococcus azoricus]MDS3860001.1 hypothetical protein [Pseudocalidococcus azoricus BACA0444]